LNLLALPVHLVLLILYWVKISGFSRVLDQTAMGSLPPQQIQGF